MTTKIRIRIATLALAVGAIGLCRLAVATPSGLGEYQDSFRVDKADLAPTGRNPYFILESGYQMRFESTEGKKKTSLTVTVTGRTEEIDGVQTRVVEERETAQERRGAERIPGPSSEDLQPPGQIDAGD